MSAAATGAPQASIRASDSRQLHRSLSPRNVPPGEVADASDERVTRPSHDPAEPQPVDIDDSQRALLPLQRIPTPTPPDAADLEAEQSGRDARQDAVAAEEDSKPSLVEHTSARRLSKDGAYPATIRTMGPPPGSVTAQVPRPRPLKSDASMPFSVSVKVLGDSKPGIAAFPARHAPNPPGSPNPSHKRNLSALKPSLPDVPQSGPFALAKEDRDHDRDRERPIHDSATDAILHARRDPGPNGSQAHVSRADSHAWSDPSGRSGSLLPASMDADLPKKEFREHPLIVERPPVNVLMKQEEPFSADRIRERVNVEGPFSLRPSPREDGSSLQLRKPPHGSYSQAGPNTPSAPGSVRMSPSGDPRGQVADAYRTRSWELEAGGGQASAAPWHDSASPSFADLPAGSAPEAMPRSPPATESMATPITAPIDVEVLRQKRALQQVQQASRVHGGWAPDGPGRDLREMTRGVEAQLQEVHGAEGEPRRQRRRRGPSRPPHGEEVAPHHTAQHQHGPVHSGAGSSGDRNLLEAANFMVDSLLEIKTFCEGRLALLGVDCNARRKQPSPHDRGERHPERHSERHADRPPERHGDRHADRHPERHGDRHGERAISRHAHSAAGPEMEKAVRKVHGGAAGEGGGGQRERERERKGVVDVDAEVNGAGEGGGPADAMEENLHLLKVALVLYPHMQKAFYTPPGYDAMEWTLELANNYLQMMNTQQAE